MRTKEMTKHKTDIKGQNAIKGKEKKSKGEYKKWKDKIWVKKERIWE